MNLQFFLNDVEQDKYFPLTVSDEGRGTSTITVPYDLAVSHSDTVEVKVDGDTLTKGIIIQIDESRRKGVKTVVSQGKTNILYQKYVLDDAHHSYSSQDAGAIVSDLISTYFSGILTGTNIDTSTGTTISSIDGYGKSVGDVIQDLADRAGCCFYVDYDDDVHFFVAGAESSGLTVTENDVFNIKKSTKGEVISKVTVHGRGGVSGSAGSGYPEKYVRDRRISTVQECSDLSQALLDKYSSAQTTAVITSFGFWSLRTQQTLTVNLPRDGYDSSTETVQRVTWRFGKAKVDTEIFVGDKEPKFEQFLARLVRDLEAKRDDYEMTLAEQSGDLDDISDGTSYERTLASYVDAGKPQLKELAQILDALFTADASGRAKFANSFIGSDLIAANAVIASKIAANQITVVKLASESTDRMFDSSVASDNVQGWKHAADATKIDGGDIYTGTVTSAKITTGQIIGKDFRTAANVGDGGGPAGIRLTSLELAGYSGGTTKQFYLLASDGKVYAGGGNVVLDANGLKVKGEYAKFYDTLDLLSGYVKGYGFGQLQVKATGDLLLDAGASDHVHSMKDLLPSANNSKDLGIESFQWKTIRGVTIRGAYQSSDGSAGITETHDWMDDAGVTHTVVVKNGIIVSWTEA